MSEALPSQRALFDIPNDITYINCAYLSPLSKAAQAAGEVAVARKVRPWTIERRHFFEEVEAVRGAFARIIHARPEDVALVPAASYGLATAAAGLGLPAGGRVIVMDHQHSSNWYCWTALAEQTGGEVVTVQSSPDGGWTEPLLDAIDERATVVAVETCHWSDGSMVNVEEVAERSRQVGAAFVLDATQTLGAIPLDVRRLQPDFMVASAYKWLFCPYGLAFLYVAPHRQNGRPLELHGYNRVGQQQVVSNWNYVLSFEPGAPRYDMGQRSDFVKLPMALIGLDQVHAWQPQRVAATLAPLTERVAQAAISLGLRVPPSAHRAPHIIGLRTGRPIAPDLQDALRARGIHVSIRGDAIRVSPHLYNAADDIDRLHAALSELL